MRDILKYIPGFRSGKKPKMIVASIYYLICLTALTNSFWTFLSVAALPFLIFSVVDVFRNRSKRSIVAVLIPLAIMIIAGSNMPDTETKESNLASNTVTQSTQPEKTNTVTKAAKVEATPTKDQQVSSPIKLEKAKVTHHTDGDTIGVTLENGQYEKVRLIGVNTPESTTKHEQYGEQASNYTKSQLYGKTVYLESDAGNTDSYGRLLRYVWLSPPVEISESEIRAKMFNAILAYNGYAEQMTIQPNAKYADYFRKFCAEARENSRGLWTINPNGTTKGDGISAPLSSASSSSSSSNKSSSSSSHGSSSSSSSSQGSTQPAAPSNGKIKGNINSKGEKIYHLPGDPYYDRTNPEAWFNTEAEAQAAGYRPIKR